MLPVNSIEKGLYMKEFDYSLVKNPEYFKDGRMEAHSDHITYANVEEASTGETSYRHSLNGIWKFHYARNYGNTIPAFFKGLMESVVVK